MKRLCSPLRMARVSSVRPPRAAMLVCSGATAGALREATADTGACAFKFAGAPGVGAAAGWSAGTTAGSARLSTLVSGSGKTLQPSSCSAAPHMPLCQSSKITA